MVLRAAVVAFWARLVAVFGPAVRIEEVEENCDVQVVSADSGSGEKGVKSFP